MGVGSEDAFAAREGIKRDEAFLGQGIVGASALCHRGALFSKPLQGDGGPPVGHEP